MDLDWLREYVSRSGIFRDDALLSFVGRGESNINYLVQDKNTQLILRAARNDVPHNPRFENEHHFLRFVEHLGINFAPKSVFYDADNQIHAISYIPGKDASCLDLDKKQQGLFFEQLSIVEHVRYEEYVEWCKAEKIDPRRSVSYKDTWQKYLDKIAYINQSKRDRFSDLALRWILERTEFVDKKKPDSEPVTSFKHGDLRWNNGSGNIRISPQMVAFIDWELAGFNYGYSFDFVDMLGTIPNTRETKEARKDLISFYNSSREYAIDPQLIVYGLLMENIGTVIWAAHRYCYLVNTKQMGKERYRERALHLMEESEIFYRRPFAEWF